MRKKSRGRFWRACYVGRESERGLAREVGFQCWSQHVTNGDSITSRV